jgi:hypothetical protein
MADEQQETGENIPTIRRGKVSYFFIIDSNSVLNSFINDQYYF